MPQQPTGWTLVQPAASAPSSPNEHVFRQWYAGMSKKHGLDPDPDSPEQRYDYRAAFKAGAKPDASGHWPSTFKQPGHPNEVVGGFNTRTGERVQGVPQASEPELVRLGWDPATAKRLSQPATADGWTLVSPSTEAPPPPSRMGFYQGAADVLGDLATGVVKGAGQSVINAGKLVQLIPGVTTAVDGIYGTPGLSRNAMTEADRVLTPSNTTQRIGKGAEQIAEIVMPSNALAKASTAVAAKVAPKLAPLVGETAAKLVPRAAVEGAGNAAIASVQGGDPTVAGVIGGAVPVVGRFTNSLAPALREAAEKQVMQALGPTKEHYKALGRRLVPQILRRGIRGSREALAEQAGNAAEAAGQEIDSALQAFGSRQVGVQPVVDALEKAKDTFRTINPSNGLVVEIEPRALKQLDGLQRVIREMGPDASVNQLVAVRRAWDKVVADAGGFSHRAPGGIGRPLADISEATHKREATTAIRQLLDQKVPELTALHKEFSFWKGLDDVVTQTLQRKQPQAATLTGAIKEAGGQAAGAAATGNIGAAFALGKLAKIANAVFTSPRWQLASAQTKDALADAISNNNATRIAELLSRIATTQGSKAFATAGGQ